MRHRALFRAFLLTALALSSLTACSDEPEGASETGASVRFVDLEDGAELSRPAEICLEVSGLTIEPSGEIRDDAGHHHLIIDPSAEEKAGYTDGSITAPLPKDETHLHMGDGSACVSVELDPGSHELLAVVGDGIHSPLDPPVVALISVTVTE